MSPTLPLRDVAAYYLRRLAERAKSSKSTAAYVDGKGGEAVLDTSIVKHAPARTVMLSSSVNGLAVDAVLFRYQGRRLPLSETVEQLGLPDMAVIGQSLRRTTETCRALSGDDVAASAAIFPN